ncbi:hypothetical protein Tco_0926790 [Tanacetum coccineum]|uniref:Uncharacterized protein n=1 Tax=Tanacetum coccineum TaxID=301880 RepID=A0ABQ5DAT8_9ASTR
MSRYLWMATGVPVSHECDMMFEELSRMHYLSAEVRDLMRQERLAREFGTYAMFVHNDIRVDLGVGICPDVCVPGEVEEAEEEANHIKLNCFCSDEYRSGEHARNQQHLLMNAHTSRTNHPELHRRRSRSRSRSRIREVEEAEEEANHIKLNCFCSDEYPFRGTCKESTTSSHVSGAAKTMSFPEGPHRDKYSKRLEPPTDMKAQTNLVADPSGTSAKYQVDETHSTRLRYRSLTENKGKTSSEVEPDIEPLQLQTFVDVQAFLLSDDEMVQESDDDVFEAGEDMDEDTQADEEKHQSLPPNTNKSKPSPDQETQESESDSSNPELKKYDNILPLNERQLVKYLRKDHVLNKKVIEATKAYTKNSTHLTELFTLIKNFDFQGLKSLVESLQATDLTQEGHLASWAKSPTSMAWNLSPRMTAVESSQAEIISEISFLRKDTSDIRSMMTEIYQAFKDQSSTPSSMVTEEPSSHTKGDTEDIKTQDTDKDNVEKEQVLDEPKPVPKPSIPQREGKGIATDDQPEQTKLVKTSSIMCPNHDAPILVPYTINRKLFYLTEEQIQAHLDKEDQIKKAKEEAKRLAMTKTEVIKIVQEEAEKIRIDPKKVISAKAGEKFKKAQDAEMQVHKRQNIKKVKRMTELNKKIAE